MERKAHSSGEDLFFIFLSCYEISLTSFLLKKNKQYENKQSNDDNVYLISFFTNENTYAH